MWQQHFVCLSIGRKTELTENSIARPTKQHKYCNVISGLEITTLEIFPKRCMVITEQSVLAAAGCSHHSQDHANVQNSLIHTQQKLLNTNFDSHYQ